MKLRRLLLLSSCLLSIPNTAQTETATPPRATIVLIVDQFAYNQVLKLQRYFKGGLKTLFSQGVCYSNAHHPHATPATATGHTAFNTGALAKDHGIVENSWADTEGKKIACDDDSAARAAVISPTGFYDYGKSAHHIMVDGISDQFARFAAPNTKNHTYALSTKSRAAIGCANKLGKAFWLDDQTGLYTSSKAYYEKLPDWVVAFNKEQKINTLTSITWDLVYNKKDACYQFPYVHNYAFTRYKKGYIGAPIVFDTQEKNPFKPFTKTPRADALLMKFAERCIQETVGKNPDDRLLLWVSFSSLDLLAHELGPDALETIDLIYHLDKNLEAFLKTVHHTLNAKEVLFVLTADHGISTIPEIAKEQGFTQAQRVLLPTFTKHVDESIAALHPDIKSLVAYADGPNIYLKQDVLKKLDAQKKKTVLRDLKKIVQEYSGIKKVWLKEDLIYNTSDLSSFDGYFAGQTFDGRSGDLIFQTYPYTIFTTYPNGTHHTTPYTYDTHVPLVIYQKGRFGGKTISTKVWTTQLANTLAQILHVPQPSASEFPLLPGLFKNKQGNYQERYCTQ